MWAWDHMISLSTLPEATEPQHSRTTTYTGKVDASKKIFMTTKILLFDFELFIRGRRQLGDAFKSNLNDLFVICLQAHFSGQWLRPSGRNPAC